MSQTDFGFSGVPVPDLYSPHPALKDQESRPPEVRRAASISFARHRMFYAKAALNAKGNVSLGLRHIRESP